MSAILGWDVVYTLDWLERKIHPRQRVGLRFFLWQLVNAAQAFFQFWRYCYGCGTFKACRCEPDDWMANSNISARTATELSMVLWKPVWDGRPLIPKPTALTIVRQGDILSLARRLHELDQLAETGPWKVYEGARYDGQDWLIGSFGRDGGTDQDVFLTTDGVHASECRGEGALSDARFCAEVRNLMPQIVEALRWRAAVERINGGNI